MLGLEGFRELLHADHVAVIDGGNGQGLRAKADGAEGHACSHAGTGKHCFCCELHRALHFRAQGLQKDGYCCCVFLPGVRKSVR